MLVSTPTKSYVKPCDSSMSASPKYKHRHCTPPRISPTYESPMLSPSPLRQRPLFPINTNATIDDGLQSPYKSPTLAHNFNPFFNPMPQPIDDDEGSIFLSSNSGSFTPFFSPSSSQPLLTPVKQTLGAQSRSALATKSSNVLFATTPTVPHSDLVSATRVGVGTKRKSTPHVGPLRANNLTPLNISQSKRHGNTLSLECLAPLAAPKFVERTPQTKAETEAYLKRHTASLTRLRLSDHNAADTDFDAPASDSGCEMDEDGDTLFLDKSRQPRSLVFQPTIPKGKDDNEVAEAVSPGGHVNKRRAKSRPLSAELRDQAFKVPKSPIRQSGIPCRVGATRPRHSGPVVFPSTAHQGRASPASSSDAGSPRPRRRNNGGSTSTRPGHNPFYPPRPPLSRIESVSAATLFFGPAIPPPPSVPAANTRSRLRSGTGSRSHLFSSGPTIGSGMKNQTPLRPNLANRHSYAGPDRDQDMWSSFQGRAVSPSPQSSPFDYGRPAGVRPRNLSQSTDEDMFFAGDEPDKPFMLNVTTSTPSPDKPRPSLPMKYKRDSLLVSDDDMLPTLSTGSSANGDCLMPKASTSVGSINSDDLDGLVTPGFGPNATFGWPSSNVYIQGTDDLPLDGQGDVDVDAFIMKTLSAASAKGSAMPRKAPGTPVKKVRMSYFGNERPWQSAVASKVGLKENCEFEFEQKKKPRKSMPAAFPQPGTSRQRSKKTNRNNNTDTEDEEEYSPSARRDRDRYTGVGLGMPPPASVSALPRNRWLMRRSSSGAFSSESDSLSNTPTRSKVIDWQLPKPRIPLRLSPSREVLSPRSTSGSSNSSITTVHSPTNKRTSAAGRAPRPSVLTSSRRQSDPVLGFFTFGSREEEQRGRFERDFDEIEEVGSGEFGKVIKVQSKIGDDREVYAIKKSKRFEGVKHRLRLREEVDILKHLSQAALNQNIGGRHPNVLAYIDSWEEDEALFIQTELCESGNLASFLWEYGRVFPRLDEARVWKIIVDLSNGLRFIHDSGVIHLDLKPSNVFVTKEGRFKIGDFGMASVWPRPATLKTTTDTASGEGCGGTGGGFEREGDKLYLAPEVLQGRYGKAADVFSLGMTILETTSNIVVPDQGEGWQRLRREDFSQVDLDGRSPELVDLMRRMMRTDPGKRMTMAGVCEHEVVSRARGVMEGEERRLLGEGKSMWGASPLASVAEGILEWMLGRDMDMDMIQNGP